MLFRYCLPKIHRVLLEFKDMAFYLWSIALMIVTGQTVKSLIESDAAVGVKVSIALAGLVTCAIQFYLGKRIGSRYDDRISAGQALGQKNTVLAIWMAYTYLDPLSSVVQDPTHRQGGQEGVPQRARHRLPAAACDHKG